MGFCLRLIEECDIVTFSRPMGKITAGVGKEVNHALKRGKIVYEITQAGLVRRHRPVKYLPRTGRLYGCMAPGGVANGSREHNPTTAVSG
jgi:hypothetical protein